MSNIKQDRVFIWKRVWALIWKYIDQIYLGANQRSYLETLWGIDPATDLGFDLDMRLGRFWKLDWKQIGSVIWKQWATDLRLHVETDLRLDLGIK